MYFEELAGEYLILKFHMLNYYLKKQKQYPFMA